MGQLEGVEALIGYTPRQTLMAMWHLIVPGVVALAASLGLSFSPLSAGAKLLTYLAVMLVFCIVVFLVEFRHTRYLRLRLALPFTAALFIGLSVVAWYLIAPLLFTALLLTWWGRSLIQAYRAPYVSESVRAWDAGQVEGALYFANLAVQARPNSTRAFLNRSRIYEYRRDWPEAEQDARTAISLKPNSPDGCFALGITFAQQARYAEARLAYAKALQRMPQSVAIHFNLGYACFRIRQYDEAIEYFSQALHGKKLPSQQISLLAHYYLARSLEAVGKGAEAQESYAAMRRFRKGLKKWIRPLPADVQRSAETEWVADYADIERRLAARPSS
jgi:tetratricopeptide (TPR) repeat protein